MRVKLIIGANASEGIQFSHANRLVLTEDDGRETSLDIPLGEVAERDFANFVRNLKRAFGQIYHNGGK